MLTLFTDVWDSDPYTLSSPYKVCILMTHSGLQSVDILTHMVRHMTPSHQVTEGRVGEEEDNVSCAEPVLDYCSSALVYPVWEQCYWCPPSLLRWCTGHWPLWGGPTNNTGLARRHSVISYSTALRHCCGCGTVGTWETIIVHMSIATVWIIGGWQIHSWGR